MLDIAVVILTYNENLHIERALRSVTSFASEIFVVDSFSTDGTPELAQRNGAIVLQNKFISHAKQFQWALNNAPITARWVMRLDADEIIESDLAFEISTTLPHLPDDVVGINLKRKQVFLNRWIRYGGRYPLLLLRIWRRGMGRIEDRWMDEHVIVWGGRTVTFEGGFADHNLRDLTFFISKHNAYATREAIEVLNQRHGFFPRDAGFGEGSGSNQVWLKRLIKERVFNRIPFQFASALYFLYRYVLQLGFLDGREGLIYHVLQGYWYRFLVGAKVFEYERAIAGFTSSREKIFELARLTGLDIAPAPEE